MFKNILWIPVVMLAATAILALGCGGEEDTGDAVQSCVSGALRDCTCDNGIESTQICSDLTETWGECQCDFARLRFCHELGRLDPVTGEISDYVQYTFTVDNGTDSVTLSAMTGECDTTAPEACAIVPAGTVNLELGSLQDGPQMGFEGVEVVAGESYTFTFFHDGTNEMPVFGKFPLNDANIPDGFGSFATETCADYGI